MKVDILLSGAGGQGLISLGKALAIAATREGRFVTYFPSYGPEVRGGAAYCFVRISDKPIPSPLAGNPDIAILLNQQSVDKFRTMFNERCLLVLNSDLIKDKSQIKAEEIIYLPLNKIALECGNIKCANMVALGALMNSKPDILKQSTIIGILKETFGSKELFSQNVKALHEGAKYGKG